MILGTPYTAIVIISGLIVLPVGEVEEDALAVPMKIST